MGDCYSFLDESAAWGGSGFVSVLGPQHPVESGTQEMVGDARRTEGGRGGARLGSGGLSCCSKRGRYYHPIFSDEESEAEGGE